MKFQTPTIDIRVALTEDGFVAHFIPYANTRMLPQCDVVEVYYVPVDCKARILADQRHGKTYKRET